MTIEAIKAAAASTYSIMEYKRGGKLHSYITKIGYKKNAKGERVVAWQYYGTDLPTATAESKKWGTLWQAIVEDYRKRRDQHKAWVKRALRDAVYDGYYLDLHDNKVQLDPTPLYEAGRLGVTTDEDVDRVVDDSIVKRTDEALEAYRQQLDANAPELPIWPTEGTTIQATAIPPVTREPKPTPSTLPSITIGEAKKLYLADYNKQVGLQSRAGLKSSTAGQHEKTLKIAFKAVDESTPLHLFDAERIEAVAHYWASPERELSPRTASNYALAFWQFLLRLPKLKLGFVLPEVDSRFFKFGKVKGKVAKYDKVQLKKLLNALDDQCKLFQLLAMQCGFYQVDLCNLKLNEIVTVGKDTFIVRHRDKTSHQGGDEFASQWWLFPETVALLKKHMAKPNPKGLVFLRPDGQSMSSLSRTGDDYVTARFKVARDKISEDVFTFKQYRKIGYTAIKKITLSTEVARIYAAKVVKDKEYDRDDAFEPLTAALKKFHEQLKADEVL